jgi:hypothetical protein
MYNYYFRKDFRPCYGRIGVSGSLFPGVPILAIDIDSYSINSDKEVASTQRKKEIASIQRKKEITSTK